jgi:hypothetical protein
LAAVFPARPRQPVFGSYTPTLEGIRTPRKQFRKFDSQRGDDAELSAP